MESLITIIHIIVALFMILVVLVQGGNQGGISAAFGGGNSQGVFGASGATTLLGKLTYGAAAVFMVTSISLTVIQSDGIFGGTKNIREQIKAQAEIKEKKLLKEEKKKASEDEETPVK